MTSNGEEEELRMVQNDEQQNRGSNISGVWAADWHSWGHGMEGARLNSSLMDIVMRVCG